MKRTRTAAAEDDRLSAGLIDNSIALQSSRNANRCTFGVMRRDQLRIRSRTESLRTRHGVRRNQLDDAQPVLAVGDERELRRADASDLNRARIVERAIRIEH